MHSIELAFETSLLDLRRRVVTVRRGEVLALLRENAMAVEIAVEPQIAENIEGVIDVFESPAWLIAAVAAFAEVLFEYLAAAHSSLISSGDPV